VTDDDTDTCACCGDPIPTRVLAHATRAGRKRDDAPTRMAHHVGGDRRAAVVCWTCAEDCEEAYAEGKLAHLIRDAAAVADRVDENELEEHAARLARRRRAAPIAGAAWFPKN
jgi:hypothetical protein